MYICAVAKKLRINLWSKSANKKFIISYNPTFFWTPCIPRARQSEFFLWIWDKEVNDGLSLASLPEVYFGHQTWFY